jgi:hypothetical protein
LVEPLQFARFLQLLLQAREFRGRAITPVNLVGQGELADGFDPIGDGWR